MHRIDGTGATIDGLFTKGNPTTGVPATVVTDDWLNAVQEEIIAVLVAAGITPNKATNTQLRDAIVAIATGGGTAITAVDVPIADAGNFFAGVEVEAALQEIGNAIANGTTAASRIRRSIVALSGAANNAAVGHLENIVEVSHGSATQYTIPADGTLTAPIGSTITIFQAGAGQVEVVAGGGVTLLKPASFNAKTMEQNAAVVIAKTAANQWRLGGTMEAAA